MRASLESPNSLRPYELSVPSDSQRHFAEGGRGGNLFPPHVSPQGGGKWMRASLERPDPLRRYELSVPSDSQRHFAEGGRGGNLFPPHVSFICASESSACS